MATRKSIPVEYLRQCVREQDGHLFWLDRPRSHFVDVRTWRAFNGRLAGKEAGSMQAKPKNPKFANRRPRWNVRIDGSMYYRSIIVWALHYGEWPPDDREVDHKSRDTLDDRISNLRLATRSQNIANTTIPATNTSGYKGVSWHAQTSKWGARISFRGRSKSLGLFDDPREAHEAYMEAARSLQGEYASDGIA